MMRLTKTVKQLLIINIIMFIGASLSGDVVYSLFGLHFPKNASFHFWQVISHMFMHGSLSHILFNMLALWMFGIAIEGVLGSKRFLFFYISCGLGAAMIQIIFLYFNFYSNLEILINAGYDPSQIFEILNQGKYSTAWSGVLGEGNLLSFMSSDIIFIRDCSVIPFLQLIIDLFFPFI